MGGGGGIWKLSKFGGFFADFFLSYRLEIRGELACSWQYRVFTEVWQSNILLILLVGILHQNLEVSISQLRIQHLNFDFNIK
jgi:hypothetical protein